MAIQAQLNPAGASNAGFQLCGGSSHDFMKDFNSQQNHQQHVCSVKYQEPLEQQQQQRFHQQQQQQQLYNEMMQRDQNLSVHPTTLHLPISNNTHPSPSLSISQSLAVEFQNERDQVDRFIGLQNEKLRIVLQEHRKQQVEALLKKVETNTLHMLIQKDEKIAQAAKKKTELEEFVSRLEAENQSLRRMAQENEAKVTSLHNTLEQVMERASSYCCFNNIGVAAEDAKSFCDESGRNMEMGGELGTGENRGEKDDAEEQVMIRKTMMMVCKNCNSRSSCFMFLPCRHLCSCQACEPLLNACPICEIPKKSSIETLIF